jgi:hypothetical protein
MDLGEIFGYLFAVGFDVMQASIDQTTGIITAQIGDAVSKITDSNGAEVWQTFGFASIPSPPGAGGGAQGIAIKRSSGDIIICGRDPRTGQIYGNLKPGEVCVFGTGADGNAQGRILIKQDGSVTLYTTDTNTKGGNGNFVRLSPPDASGGGGFEVVVAGAKMTLGPNGFHVTAGSAQLDLGSVNGLPGPLAPLGSYFTITCGSTTLNSPLVMLGPSLSPLGYNPVAYGLAANPLTTPPIPILNGFPGTPNGLVCASGVFVGGP